MVFSDSTEPSAAPPLGQAMNAGAATSSSSDLITQPPAVSAGPVTAAPPSVTLSHYEAACRALADAKNVDEIRAIHNAVDAIRAAARVARNKQLEVDAAEIRFRAERALGEMMAAQKEAVGLAKGGHPYQQDTGFRQNPVARPPTLAEAGIDKNLANRARKLAAIPRREFDGMVSDWRNLVTKETERVTTKLLKTADCLRRNAEIRGGNRPLPPGKFSVIYADPPWTFKAHQGEGNSRATENHFPTMAQADIEALPVASLAADDCALFLWAVMPQLPEALRVIAAWGFEYKTCAFVWVKQTRDGENLTTGMGNWTRANAELCLLATRGSPRRLTADVHQVVLAPRFEHSRKPEEVAARISRLIGGPHLELFARVERPGWSVWGNEVTSAQLEEQPAIITAAGGPLRP